MNEFEWGVSSLEGVERFITPAEGRADARRIAVDLRVGYPWPEEIYIVKREVAPWVRV